MVSEPASVDLRLRARFARRWHVAVAGLAVTAALCAFAMRLVPTTYTAEAYFILTPPKTTSADTTPNPYLGLGGLRPLADVVSRSMTSGAALRDLRAQGLTGDYSVVTDPTTDSPIVAITADGSDGETALRNVKLVLATAPAVLARIQDAKSVAESARVVSQDIATPTHADASHKSQLRALAVALAVGLAGSALAVCVIDIIFVRRRSTRGRRTDRKSRREGSSGPEDADPGLGAGLATPRFPEAGELAVGALSPDRAEDELPSATTQAGARYDLSEQRDATTGDEHALVSARQQSAAPTES